MYGARHVALKAGLPVTVPALTVNRLVRIGNRSRRPGRADDPARQGGGRAHRRHGEHEPGAARDSRPEERPAARPGAARGHVVVGASRYALRLHDGGDGGELRGEVRCDPRGSGRVHRPQPATGGAGLGGRPFRRRSRAGRTEDPQGNRRLRPGRSPAARDDDGGVGETADGVQQERLRHRRQRIRHRRRRSGIGARVRKGRSRARH